MLNVFARAGEPFSGNALCVFEDGSGLADDQMQGLARQFNLSETTFLSPRGDNRDQADAAVRIFTADHEMPFAGHPTLGTAHVVQDLLGLGDHVRLSMPAGVIPVRRDADTWTLTANRGSVTREFDPGEFAAAIGLGPADLVGPVQEVSTGTAQIIARAASTEVLRSVVADPARLHGLPGTESRGGSTLAYLWAEMGEGSIEARALVSQGTSIVEDPATGSACTNLGTWLAAQGQTGLRWKVSQGAHVGRPSTLHLTVTGTGEVQVGGLVKEIGRGEVAL